MTHVKTIIICTDIFTNFFISNNFRKQLIQAKKNILKILLNLYKITREKLCKHNIKKNKLKT